MLCYVIYKWVEALKDSCLNINKCKLTTQQTFQYKRFALDQTAEIKTEIALVTASSSSSSTESCQTQLLGMDKGPSVLWHCWLGGRKGIWPVKNWKVGAGMVICMERGADLHMAQLMPLPSTISCFSKIQIAFTFLVNRLTRVPEKGPLNGCMYVRDG